MTTNHAPPADPTPKEVEAGVISGIILFRGAALDEIASIVEADDFTFAHHKLIYAAAHSLWRDGKPVEFLTVGDELFRRKQIDDVGGYAKYAEFNNPALAPSLAGAIENARSVHNRAVLARLADAGRQIADAAERTAAPADEQLADADQLLTALAESGPADAVPLRQVLASKIEQIDRDGRAGARELTGLPTGLIDLDGLLGGLNRGELVVIAARPAVGKTSLALQAALFAALESGAVTLFASLEMSRDELAGRLLCGAAGVDSRDLRRGKVHDADSRRLLDAQLRIQDAPLMIDDTPMQRVGHVAATARRIRRRQGLHLVVVDYLQLVEPENRRDPRHEQVGQTSRRLKGLAKSLDVPVVALCQLNRDAENSSQPKMSHLRESGSIEADADVVLLMHRPDNARDKIAVIVEKNRNGPTGSVELAWRKEYTRFENYAGDTPPGG